MLAVRGFQSIEYRDPPVLHPVLNCSSPPNNIGVRDTACRSDVVGDSVFWRLRGANEG
jgi:hypothetical protein